MRYGLDPALAGIVIDPADALIEYEPLLVVHSPANQSDLDASVDPPRCVQSELVAPENWTCSKEPLPAPWAASAASCAATSAAGRASCRLGHDDHHSPCGAALHRRRGQLLQRVS